MVALLGRNGIGHCALCRRHSALTHKRTQIVCRDTRHRGDGWRRRLHSPAEFAPACISQRFGRPRVPVRIDRSDWDYRR